MFRQSCDKSFSNCARAKLSVGLVYVLYLLFLTGLPPLEIDPDKKKRKEKRKEKKEKKTGGKKKEVPKLTLKLLSSAASLSEPLFEPTPLVAAPAIVPPKKSGATTGNNKTPPKGKVGTVVSL